MKAAGAFVLFLLLAIAWTWPARAWPMVFDDLHLVRTFSGSELAAAWTGHWDPDGLETPGFRPLSLAFNHVRAALFGERVIGHRHALAALVRARAGPARALWAAASAWASGRRSPPAS